MPSVISMFRRSQFCLTALLTAVALVAASSAMAGPEAKLAADNAKPDVTSGASKRSYGTGKKGPELPIRRIPNIPQAVEAYYAPDSFHIISYLQDPAAQRSANGKTMGSLTYTYTDQGTEIKRINDHGDDACSYYFHDMKHLIWTSTRDNLDMPPGDWTNDDEYPQGAELYVSDLDGKHLRRLTHNKNYEAEVTVSPDGRWVFFGREIDGKMDIWRMRTDGTGEQQLTFTDDWQEGAPYPLPDNKHIIFRAWKQTEKHRLAEGSKSTGRRAQTPMTIFTMNYDGTDVQPRTFTRDMNWAPYPTPDGQHFLYVRVYDANNWEVVMSDLAGGEPKRMTNNPGFDGFPSISPDGKKMLFARTEEGVEGLNLYVMDVSSLNVGPENYKGSIPAKSTPPAGWVADPDLAAFERHSKKR
jgi:TolB protein